MRSLFDPGTPAPLRFHLEARAVTEAREGWDRLFHCDLLDAAEEAGFCLIGEGVT
jgi:hypothetical protein